MIKKLLIAGFMCLIGVSSVFAGGNSESAATGAIDGPIDIVATTGMIGDIVSNVAGDRGSVFVLMDDEVDPHLFRPTRSDVARMQQADIIFYNGLNLEGQMADTLVQLARSRPVFAVTELVDNTAVLEDEEDDAYFDPHLWMDCHPRRGEVLAGVSLGTGRFPVNRVGVLSGDSLLSVRKCMGYAPVGP